MVVKTIKVHKRKQAGGVAVTFTISPEVFASMTRAAEKGGYFGTADYIAGGINFYFHDHDPLPGKSSGDPDPSDDGIPF